MSGGYCTTPVTGLPHIFQHLLLKSKHFPRPSVHKQYMTTFHCPLFATADACLYIIVAVEQPNLRLESGYTCAASTITVDTRVLPAPSQWIHVCCQHHHSGYTCAANTITVDTRVLQAPSQWIHVCCQHRHSGYTCAANTITVDTHVLPAPSQWIHVCCQHRHPKAS